MKQYSYNIPERKIGEVFTYNGASYQVMDATELPLCSEIGCCIRENNTGNIRNLCAFASYCGMVNQRHRGYCAPYNRKDGKIVYFKKIK